MFWRKKKPETEWQRIAKTLDYRSDTLHCTSVDELMAHLAWHRARCVKTHFRWFLVLRHGLVLPVPEEQIRKAIQEGFVMQCGNELVVLP